MTDPLPADLVIRRLEANDRAWWLPFWLGHLAFYDTDVSAGAAIARVGHANKDPTVESSGST